MKAHLVIPIHPGPSLTAEEIDAFCARASAEGVDPSVKLAGLVSDAIRAAVPGEILDLEGAGREASLTA